MAPIVTSLADGQSEHCDAERLPVFWMPSLDGRVVAKSEGARVASVVSSMLALVRSGQAAPFVVANVGNSFTGEIG